MRSRNSTEGVVGAAVVGAAVVGAAVVGAAVGATVGALCSGWCSGGETVLSKSMGTLNISTRK